MQYKKKPHEALEKEIFDFLDSTCCLVDPNPSPHSCGLIHRSALVLATSYNDEPRATPLEFFHEGFTIYIFGEPGGKIANIKRNDRVCAAIYEQPMDHTRIQTSLQLWGKAELLHIRNNRAGYMEKVVQWNMLMVVKKLVSLVIKNLDKDEQEKMIDKMLGTLNLIRIEPYRMVLRRYNPDFSMPKYEWKKL